MWMTMALMAVPVALLVLFDLVAVCWGVDSRESADDREWQYRRRQAL